MRTNSIGIRETRVPNVVQTIALSAVFFLLMMVGAAASALVFADRVVRLLGR
jgi:hypothetical protein